MRKLKNALLELDSIIDHNYIIKGELKLREDDIALLNKLLRCNEFDLKTLGKEATKEQGSDITKTRIAHLKQINQKLELKLIIIHKEK
jgi:hypothetical protein